MSRHECAAFGEFDSVIHPYTEITQSPSLPVERDTQELMLTLEANQVPEPKQVKHWTNVVGCAASRFLTKLVKSQDSPVVLVANSPENVRHFEAELQYFDPTLDVLVVPDHETLPYDTYSPPTSLVSERIRTLYNLPFLKQGVIIVPIRTIMQYFSPKDYISRRSLSLGVNERFNLKEQAETLTERGYRRVDVVYSQGEFTVRGSLLDLFPIGSTNPVRIDTFDDEIETLRYFDIESQLTIEKVNRIDILPTKEYQIDEEGIRRFRTKWLEHFDVDVRYCPIYQDVSEGISPEGVECFMPLFFDETSTFFDYLPQNSLFVLDDDIESEGAKFWEEIETRYESLRHDISRPLLPPHEVFIRLDQVQQSWNSHARIQLHQDDKPQRHCFNIKSRQIADVTADRRSKRPLQQLSQHLRQTDQRTLFVAESNGRREFLSDFLTKGEIPLKTFDSFGTFEASDATIGISVSSVERSCQFHDIQIISELDLFDSHSAAVSVRDRKKTIDPSLIIRNLFEIEAGTAVVHVDYGIGIYRGLELLQIDGIPVELVTLEYAKGDVLRIPVTSLHLLNRYIGGEESEIKTDRLGSDRWRKVKERAAKRVHDVGAELLNMLARREMSQSFAFKNPDSEFDEFCNQCSFQLTEDQQLAVESIIRDLNLTRAMDRMVCGDVGFGKTEVAMRAAFHVAQQGKQVLVLVPTTVLARQHYESFQDRFADWPVEIDHLTRHRTSKERSLIMEKLAAGSIDILIGTHQLLNPSIEYKDLGLLVVDEEHRFGVRHKERIRQLKAQIDLLTLTATPIPRTLNMTLEGLRDLSLIETPPARRLSIRTFVVNHDWFQIRDAIHREIDRGGQVYYLHNQVRTIHQTKDEIEKLVPHARVLVAHGQMAKAEIENAMLSFYHRQANVLVSTTIIESGIDVPNANTIIIERADKLGLAQLHQIRGRVGRSHHQAYAYLTTPQDAALTSDSERRLDAIAQADELGAGFKLAMADLEIRGAGELLGQAQSGEIEDIGYELYMRMLEETVESMKSNRVPDLDKPFKLGHEVDLSLPALIPHAYLPDVKARLILYKRIANAFTKLEIDHLMAECIDRFGTLPEELQNLFRITKIKLDAIERGVGTIRLSGNRGLIEFVDPDRFDLGNLLRLIQNPENTETYDITDSGRKLRLTHNIRDFEDRITFIEDFLHRIKLEESLVVMAS